jgi:glycosyltransferase involved in cell wall biosynthesis
VRTALLNSVIERLRPWYLRHVYFKWVPRSKPDYFSSCWNLPEFSHSLQNSSRDLTFIFLPMNDWHTRTQRNQHLALDLARRGYPVVYVNPHLGREFPDTLRCGEEERLMQIENNLLELHIHLPREPVFHHRLLTGAESLRISTAVTNALRRTGARRAVQVVSFPIWLDAAVSIRGARGAPLIYDCHDYLAGFSNVAQEIIDREADLFRSSDLVLCSANSLMNRAAAETSSPCVLLRNAAAHEFFSVMQQLPDQVTIGYAGAIDSWFDADAIRFAAQARPQWRFELIGRVESAAVAALADLPNVHLAGEVPFSELPRRLAKVTAAIIPFRLNPLIQATDPIKAYEYLACGLPVVASQMPELERFGDLISFYKTPADFLAQLDQAAVPEPVETRERRRRFVATETWQARGAKLAELAEKLSAEYAGGTGPSR